jgi:hypothetical protein
MEILLDRKLFLNKFLIPVNKFTDQAVLSLNKEFIDCLSTTTSDKQTIILYTKLTVKTDMQEDNIKLNIGSIKKLVHGLNCLTDDIIKLKVDNNKIVYKSDVTNFILHLKEDGVVTKQVINLDKINAVVPDTELTILPEKLDELLKASSFSTDSEKVYLTITDNVLMAELTDKTIQNLDSIKVALSNDIKGKHFTDPIPLKLDIFKLLSSLKFEKLVVKLTNKGALIFEIKDDNHLLKYITSSLIK